MKIHMHTCTHAHIKNCAEFLRISAILNHQRQWPRFTFLFLFSLVQFAGFSGCSDPISDTEIDDQANSTPRPSVESVPLSERFIGTYSGASSQLTELDLKVLDSAFTTVFADSLDATASLDSAYIYDSPETDSIPYLVLEGVVNDSTRTYGIELRREDGFYYCLTNENDPNQLERVWKCTKQTSCVGRCKKLRNGIGVVTDCSCTGGVGGCNFDEYGGWGIDALLLGIIVYMGLQ